MAIQFFDNSSDQSQDLEFAADYLKKNPKDAGKAFPITEITLAKSGKGYMCKTDYFLCWLWKREQTTSLLLEALQSYVDSRYGYSIVAVLDKSLKAGFKLGVDPEQPCMWYGSGKKYTTTQDIPILETKDGNPFLILPAPSILDVPMGNSDINTSQGLASNNGKKR